MRLIVLCAAALLGLALGDLEHLEPRQLIFGGLVALLGACLAWRHPAWRWLALSACAVAAGGLRAATLEPTPPSPLTAYVSQVIRLGGALVDPPTLSSTGASVRLSLEVEAIDPAGQILSAGQNADSSYPALGPSVVDTSAHAPSARAVFAGATAAFGPPTTVDPPHAPSASPRISSNPAALGPHASGGPPSAARARVNVVGDPAVLGLLSAGDYVVLEGRVLAGDSRAPPTLFFPRLVDRLAPRAPSPMAWLANVRATATAGIQRYLPEPQASLSSGVLLGGSGQLDGDFRLQLQRSGLAHLVAIDGYKQVIVAAALGAVSVRLLGARLATLPIVLGIAGYTLLTGAHPSAVRAGLMVGLASVASLTGRVADPLTSLVVAVLAMAALDPRILLDVGLQLSLSATLGIILLWPWLRRRLRGVPSFIAEPVGLTLAVTVATLPVTLSVFQSVSLVSPVAHILAVPLLPVVLASTALLAAVSGLEPLALAAAWLAWVPSTLLVEIIRVLGSLSGAALSTGRLPTQAALCLAAGLLVWGLVGLPEAAGMRLWWARLRLAQRPGSLPAVSVCACLVAIAILQLVRPDERLHVYALQAGRGEAVFIRGPTGRTALVVAGRVDAAMLAGQVADHLAVWEHKLDNVIRLDPAAETGLGLTLARYPADQRSNAEQDERIDLGGGAVLDVYATASTSQAVSVSFDNVWLPLLGQPPPPPTSLRSALPAPEPRTELVSDGTEIWATSAEQ